MQIWLGVFFVRVNEKVGQQVACQSHNIYIKGQWKTADACACTSAYLLPCLTWQKAGCVVAGSRSTNHRAPIESEVHVRPIVESVSVLICGFDRIITYLIVATKCDKLISWHFRFRLFLTTNKIVSVKLLSLLRGWRSLTGQRQLL